MNFYKSLLHTLREISRGSGKINIITVGIYTLTLYFAFLVGFNSEFIALLIKNKTASDFKSIHEYIAALSSLELDRTYFIVPGLVSIMLLIPYVLNIKSNTLNRLLPISIHTRIVAIFISILFITSLSLGMIILLNQLVLLFTRYSLLPELIKALESIGELYKQLPSEYMLSQDYVELHYITPIIIIVYVFSLFLNIIMFNVGLFFKTYSWFKGLAVFLFTLFAITYFHSKHRFASASEPYLTLQRDVSFPFIVMFFIIAMLTMSLYFLLKEREE